MACEITVKLKNSRKTLTRVSPIIQRYVSTDPQDLTIKIFVDDVINEFDDIVEKKSVIIKLIED